MPATAHSTRLPVSACPYVLVTPARNEAVFIEKTLQAMVAQTMPPLRWVIVSDGSTDGTDELVEKYAARHAWIELVKMPPRRERHFAGKVMAFNAGYDRVKHLGYHVIGNLDADSSFDPEYLEYLLNEFLQNRRLGVAGTNYVEEDWDNSLKHDYRFANIEDVTGQCQLFRRECFEDIGGYKPNKLGGIDLIATISARMHGWQTRVFTGKVLFHHRQQGTAQAHKFLVEFSNGKKDYLFGSHPLWQTCRAIYRMTKRPVVLGGCLLWAGYLWAMLRRFDRTVSKELAAFRRTEQMRRLKTIFRRSLGKKTISRAATRNDARAGVLLEENQLL
jgi:poly-beta-1,6-N-acetyl-D-glucosamine synthase